MQKNLAQNKNSFFLNHVRPIGIIGLLGLIIGFLSYWNTIKNPNDLKIYVDDETNIVEVKEKIADLKITYNNEDISKSRRGIKLVSITIANYGKNILQNEYDQNDSFGIIFDDSIVLNCSIKESNSDYLKDNYRKYLSAKEKQNKYGATDRVVLPKIIMDKGKYIKLKIYLLQPENVETTKMKIFGKIAGIDPIRIIRTKERDKTNSAKQKYLYIFLGMLIPIGGLSAFVLGDLTRDYFRKRKSKTYK